MIFKLLISVAILTYSLGVPWLEVNDTHVFNPNLTPHFRIHEVWQLLTNSSIGIYCLYLVWRQGNYKLASFLSLLVINAFLLAFFMQNLYGGSMAYIDGSENKVFGINIGLFGFGLVSIIFTTALLKPDNKD